MPLLESLKTRHDVQEHQLIDDTIQKIMISSQKPPHVILLQKGTIQSINFLIEYRSRRSQIENEQIRVCSSRSTGSKKVMSTSSVSIQRIFTLVLLLYNNTFAIEFLAYNERDGLR